MVTLLTLSFPEGYPFNPFIPAMFSLPTLILKLVSGAALLTLIATFIDTLALYLLPNKGTYRKIVYEESPDFKKASHDQKKGVHDHKQKPEKQD